MSKQPLDFKKMLNKYFHGNPKVWEFDRKETLGASETFQCLRKAWLEKFGEDNDHVRDEVDNDNWGAMERGNIIEDHFIVPAIEFGKPKYVKYKFAGQDNQKTIRKDKSSATPDGILTNLKKNALALYGIDDIESDCILTEFKSVDPRSNVVETKAVHFGQAQMQLGLIRDETKYKPMYCVVIYINASFLNDIKPYVVKFDPAIYKSGQMRANQIYSTDDPSTIKAEGKQNGSCEYCQWKMACSKISGDAFPENNEVDEIDQANIDQFDALVTKHEKLKNIVADYEKQRSEVNQEIRAQLSEKNFRRVTKPLNWRISYSWQKGRTSLDQKAMVAAGIDLNPFQKEGSGFDKLNITMIKDKNDE